MQGRTRGNREHDDSDNEIEDKNRVPNFKQRGETLEHGQADGSRGRQNSDSEEECRRHKSQDREMDHGLGMRFDCILIDRANSERSEIEGIRNMQGIGQIAVAFSCGKCPSQTYGLENENRRQEHGN